MRKKKTLRKGQPISSTGKGSRLAAASPTGSSSSCTSSSNPSSATHTPSSSIFTGGGSVNAGSIPNTPPQQPSGNRATARTTYSGGPVTGPNAGGPSSGSQTPVPFTSPSPTMNTLAEVGVGVDGGGAERQVGSSTPTPTTATGPSQPQHSSFSSSTTGGGGSSTPLSAAAAAWYPPTNSPMMVASTATNSDHGSPPTSTTLSTANPFGGSGGGSGGTASVFGATVAARPFPTFPASVLSAASSTAAGGGGGGSTTGAGGGSGSVFGVASSRYASSGTVTATAGGGGPMFPASPLSAPQEPNGSSPPVRATEATSTVSGGSLGGHRSSTHSVDGTAGGSSSSNTATPRSQIGLSPQTRPNFGSTRQLSLGSTTNSAGVTYTTMVTDPRATPKLSPVTEGEPVALERFPSTNVAATSTSSVTNSPHSGAGRSGPAFSNLGSGNVFIEDEDSGVSFPINPDDTTVYEYVTLPDRLAATEEAIIESMARMSEPPSRGAGGRGRDHSPSHGHSAVGGSSHQPSPWWSLPPTAASGGRTSRHLDANHHLHDGSDNRSVNSDVSRSTFDSVEDWTDPHGDVYDNRTPPNTSMVGGGGGGPGGGGPGEEMEMDPRMTPMSLMMMDGDGASTAAFDDDLYDEELDWIEEQLNAHQAANAHDPTLFF